MYCTNCGAWNGDDWAFCTGCGTPLMQDAPGQPQQFAVPVAPGAPGAQGMPGGFAVPAVNAVQGGGPSPNRTVDLNSFQQGASGRAGAAGSGRQMSLVRRRTGQVYDIAPLPATVGKGSAATVRIDNNNTISRAHVRISFTGASFVMEELGATNCTYLNGKCLAPNEIAVLRDGDELKLSDEVFDVRVR